MGRPAARAAGSGSFPHRGRNPRVPGLRLGQQRSHALLSALLIFRLQPDGFANRDLRAITSQLRGLAPELVSPGQMTYDLRRLRTHALIQRVPHTHRYQVTDHGLHTAMFLTRVHDRLLPTGLAHLAERSTPGPLRCRHRLPERDRQPHQRNRPRLMTTTGAPQTKLDPKSRLRRALSALPRLAF